MKLKTVLSLLFILLVLYLISPSARSYYDEEEEAPKTKYKIRQERGEEDVRNKPEYEFLADSTGNIDGYSEKKEETHLDNKLAKLINKLERFKRLPQKLKGISMNFPERVKKYGLFIFTDKDLKCIAGKNQLYVSIKEILKKKGGEVFEGCLLKYDKHLALKDAWRLDNIRIDDEENWKPLNRDDIKIDYYSIMRKRRSVHTSKH